MGDDVRVKGPGGRQGNATRVSNSKRHGREVVVTPAVPAVCISTAESTAQPRASFSEITTRYRYIRLSDVPWQYTSIVIHSLL